MAYKRKQFCTRNHDTFITGRYKDGACIQCDKDRNKRYRATLLCPKGHDKNIVGRAEDGYCLKCREDRKIKKQQQVPRTKQLFCKRGHEIAVVGRYPSGACIGCHKERDMAKIIANMILKQFCSKNHDTFIVGREKNGSCKQCVKEKRDLIENKIKVRENSKKHYEAHKEEILARHKKWNEEHIEELKKQHKDYKKEHPEIVVLIKLNQEAKRAERIVPWGQEGMQEFYLNKPRGIDGDHIIPLQGKLVSGLHVRWNLQYMPHLENSVKKITVEEATKFYEKILIEAGLK